MLPTGGGFWRWASVKPVPTENVRPLGSSTTTAPSLPDVTALARQMLDHAAFGIVEALDFEQRGRAARLVLRARLPEHQPLATERFDAGQFRSQVADSATSLLLQHAGIGQKGLAEHFHERCLPDLEWPADSRGVEHDETDLPPMVALVVAADDAHRALERLAVQPQFAVQGHAGQPGCEPRGGMIDIALPRKELPAIPPGPHAIELLAHPPAGQVRVVVPRMGQEQLGTVTVASFVLAMVAGAKEPSRSRSICSPRNARRCLQVRRSIGND